MSGRRAVPFMHKLTLAKVLFSRTGRPRKFVRHIASVGDDCDQASEGDSAARIFLSFVSRIPTTFDVLAARTPLAGLPWLYLPDRNFQIGTGSST